MPIGMIDAQRMTLDTVRDMIELARTHGPQTPLPDGERSTAAMPPPPPARQERSAGTTANSAQSQATAAPPPPPPDQSGTSLPGLLDLSATSGSSGATALLATDGDTAAAGGDIAATPTARPDQIALFELLLADPLLCEVVATYCPDTPTSLPSNATTDALVAQFGMDLTCRMLQASTAITRVFGDYCAAMDQAAVQGPEAGGAGWVFTPGTPGQGDCDGTADQWTFHPDLFTADFAKGDSLASRAFADMHGSDGSFALISRAFCGTTDAGDIYALTSGGIDPDSAQFKWQDIGDGGGEMRWESPRMGHNALVQIDLNDPLEMFDPKAVWFEPTLGFVTANENIVPEDSTAETIVVTVVIGVVTWGVGTAICTAYGVTNAIAVGAIMGATGSVIGGLFQNGTVCFEDVVRGAVTGAIMGAVTQNLDAKGIDAKTGAVTDWGARLGAITTKATVQGMLAELTGGEFKDAFGQGFVAGLAAEVGRSINAEINRAIDSKNITAEQASAYRTLGRAVTTALAAMGDPDSPLAGFAETFLGDTLKADFTLPAADGTNTAGSTSTGSSTGFSTGIDTEDGAVDLDFGGLVEEMASTGEGTAVQTDHSTTPAEGNTPMTGISEREQEGIEQSDEILFRRGDELADANGLNPVRLPDGRLQYPDGRILTPGGEVIADASQEAGNPSAYPSQYRHIHAVAGIRPQGDLTLAPDLPQLPPESTPILADGRHGLGVPYRDEAGRVFYQTYDADGNPVRLLSTVAASAPLPLADVASAAAPLAAAVLNAERTVGPWPLRIAAGATLVGTTWLIAQGTDGAFTREALSPEQVRDDQSPLINVPVHPGPVGTPGLTADQRDTSTPGQQIPDSPGTSTTTLPVTEPSWADPVVDIRTHDNAHGFSTRDINPHEPNAGGDLNCIKCALALDATLGGSPTQALPGIAADTFAGGRRILEQTFGASLVKIGSPEAIAQAISEAGPAARGIVIGYQNGQPYSHAINVVNQDGVIRFLDGQIGEAAKDVDKYDHYWLIITTGGK